MDKIQVSRSWAKLLSGLSDGGRGLPRDIHVMTIDKMLSSRLSLSSIQPKSTQDDFQQHRSTTFDPVNLGSILILSRRLIHHNQSTLQHGATTGLCGKSVKMLEDSRSASLYNQRVQEYIASTTNIMSTVPQSFHYSTTACAIQDCRTSKGFQQHGGKLSSMLRQH